MTNHPKLVRRPPKVLTNTHVLERVGLTRSPEDHSLGIFSVGTQWEMMSEVSSTHILSRSTVTPQKKLEKKHINDLQHPFMENFDGL